MHGISIPSRTGVWLGIIIYIWGYYLKASPLMIIGFLMVIAGAFLWFIWGDKSKKKNKTTIKDQIKSLKDKIKKIRFKN